jgi:methionine-rich copper-binding protein CopC
MKIEKKILFFIVALLFSQLSSHSSFAHAEVAKTYPVKNAILSQSPKSVWMEFGESLLTLDEKKINQLTVSDSRGKRVDKSPTIISGVRATTKISGILKKGKYVVTYRVVSEDGHPVKGSYSFSVK